MIGISLVALGMLGLLGATIQYRQALERLEQGTFTYQTHPLTLVVALVLLVIGLVCVVVIVLG